MSPTVFQQVLRAPFFNLPDSLRELHSIRGTGHYHGQVEVERGRNPLARLCGWMVKLPPAMGDATLHLALHADGNSETWQRDFAGHCMNSRLRCRERLLCERIGPLTFRFALHAADGVLYWNAVRVRVLGILPLPARLFSGMQCREYQQDDRYHFEVKVRLPLAGLLIRYHGWLEPSARRQS